MDAGDTVQGDETCLVSRGARFILRNRASLYARRNRRSRFIQQTPCLPLRKAESGGTVQPTDNVPPFTRGIGGSTVHPTETVPPFTQGRIGGTVHPTDTVPPSTQGGSRRLNPIETCLVTRGSRFIPQSPCLLYAKRNRGARFILNFEFLGRGQNLCYFREARKALKSRAPHRASRASLTNLKSAYSWSRIQL